MLCSNRSSSWQFVSSWITTASSSFRPVTVWCVVVTVIACVSTQSTPPPLTVACTEKRSTFLPGALLPDGDVDYALYDASSPLHGTRKRNASHLEVTSPTVVYHAAPVVVLSDIRATLVDHYGVPLTTGFPCVVKVWLTDAPGLLTGATKALEDILPSMSLPATRSRQYAVFSGLTLYAPFVGTYVLRFQAVDSNRTRRDAVGQFTFAVVPHYEVAQMRIVRPPSALSNSYAPLSRQPVLTISDALNNTAVDYRAQGTVVASVVVQNGSAAVTPPEGVAWLSGHIVTMSAGFALFTSLQLHLPASLLGRNYTLFFRYVTNAGVSTQLYATAPGRSSYCNTTALQPIVDYFPDRAFPSADNVSVVVRGGIYSDAARASTGYLCRVASFPVFFAVVLDECNLLCIMHPPYPTTRVNLSVSLDGGVSYSTPVPLTFLGVDTSLRLRFDDRTADGSSIVTLDALGNTVVGTISVYVVDEHNNDMLNYTSQAYSVTLSMPGLTLGGVIRTIAVNGYAQFGPVTLRGFPEVGTYIALVSGTDLETGISLFGSRSFVLQYLRNTSCIPPPVVLNVSSPGCRSRVGATVLSSCGSGEVQSVVVNGLYFLLSGATVFVGSQQCSEVKHDAVSIGAQLNCLCYFPSTNSTITVVTSGGQVYRSPSPAFIMAQPVNVSHVTGCPNNVHPSTGGCFTNQSTLITIFGSNFGVSFATVYLNHIFTSIVIRCPNVTHSTTSPTTVLTCSIPVALGVGLVVTVRNAATGQLGYPSNYAAVSYLASTGVLCQTDSEGNFCSQRGTCFLQNGTCDCVASPSSGYWSGVFCQNCLRGYFGSTCQNACPSCSPTSSYCDDGILGTGKCVCSPGWLGALCNIQCPGGAATPCNLHGTCNSDTQDCTCFSSPATGFWSGASCSSCVEGWSGVSCDVACPRAENRVCAGHGTCIDGACKCAQNYCDSACNVSFAGCSGCASGTYGKLCDRICPGGVDNVCNGNGFCGEGPFGSGLCSCYDGWGGANCTITCPGGPSNLCSGSGTCDVEMGVCTCFPGFTLVDCSRPCPGGATNPCTGHGTCFVVNATCSCDFGWSGLACDVVCPGGLASPCNLHGTCVQATSQCACHADTFRGYWAGPTCSTCDPQWWGPGCRAQCPFAYGLQCGGHGQCNNDVVCTCLQSSTTGFWSGADCGECAHGYYGSSCVAQCPGSACNPCFSKGNCSQGVNGTGVCTCDSSETDGFWSGVVCDACLAGWFGDNCTSQCPMGASGKPCSGRGLCSDGRTGTGLCTCFDKYGGANCGVCNVGYWGPGCGNQCPGPIGEPCRLRGVCDNTENSTGTCTCDLGYGGKQCEFVCPVGPYGVCNGQGTCVLNALGTAMQCVNCSSSIAGFWTGPSCSDCLPGYYGSLCKNACPGGAATPCNGRGSCSSGYSGSGVCTCSFGYAGLSCEKICVGGALIPCSSHGTCDSVTGACTCFSDASVGYWVGSACDSCDALYASSSCTVACPTAVPGVACSGHGICFQGLCLSCDSGFCGPMCSATSGCVLCPAGTYGSSCTDCPGGRATPCFNQGICLQGPLGSGSCVCNVGFRGSNCSIRCPGPTGVPCYGRGTCSADGVCSCTTQWAGPDCNTPCNGYSALVTNSTACNGVGTCNKADGSCSCFYGFGGASCNITCPGTSVPCNGRGYCSPVNGTCECYQNSTIGFWNGPSCSYCQSGYYSSTCAKKCFQGVSDASFTQCVCNPYWSGPGCDIPCPGLLTINGTVCYGHGTCLWGSTLSGRCSCVADWYDPNCLTFCTKSGCDAVLIHGQCNAASGVCECQFDASGHWDYTTSAQLTCEVCNINYFGESCQTPCACSQHGTCDRRTGACTCYANPIQGYWGGTSCSTCATSYIGVSCQQLNVAISPLGTVAAAVTVPVLDVTVGIICSDPLYPYVYVGTTPVAVLANGTGRTVSVLQLGGLAIRCVYRNSRELYIVTFSVGKMLLNVIDRATAEFLRTEIVPLVASASAAAERAAAYYTRRQLFQFETVNATVVNGAVLAASGMMQSFDGASDDIVITPYTFGSIQYYQISTGVSEVLSSGFTSITDSRRLDDSSSQYVIVGTVAADASSSSSSQHWEIALIDNDFPTPASVAIGQTLLDYPTTKTFYAVYGLLVRGICSSCQALRVFGTSQFVVVIFSSPSVGMYLARFGAAAANGSDSSSFVMQYFYGTACTVTATVLDLYAGTGYFAFNCGSGSPSTVMKFDLATCVVSGTIGLTESGTDVEIVVTLTIDAAARTLFALIPLSRSQRLQKASLYAVSSLSPLIADTKGGTSITVFGEGFVEGMLCVFSSQTSVAASFVDRGTLLCRAPPGGTVSCAGEPVEVALPGSGATNNGKLLQRVASAAIHTVVSSATLLPLGFLGGGNVTVLGSGFVLPSNASLLLCKLYSPSHTWPNNITVIARFISSYEVHCTLPEVAAPLAKPSYLEVSIDGTVFSVSEVPYDVLGLPSSLFISSPATGSVVVKASRVARLPPVVVNIADSAFHPLGSFANDSSLYHVSVSVVSSSASTRSFVVGTLELGVTEGVAVFDNVSLASPMVGTVQLLFTELDSNWTAALVVQVVEGEPYRLYFAQLPSSTVTNDSPTLATQPIVGILDSSGNALSSMADKAVSVDTITLTYWYVDLSDMPVFRTVAIPQLNAKFRVEGVSITGKHEASYYLLFSAPQLPVSTLESSPIVVGWCQGNQFAIANSTACESCPNNAVCDGSFAIRAMDNWWRADNTTLAFYSCGAPYSGDSCFNNSQCRDGYHGPRCSLCARGYGRSGRFCVQCQSSSANSAIVIVATTVLLMFITLMVYSIVMTSADDLLPVLIRNAVTYAQILARFSDTRMTWPTMLDSLWRTISSIANLQAIDFSPFDCAMQLDFFHRYVLTLLVPWIMIALVAPLAIAVVKFYAREDSETLAALTTAMECRDAEDASTLSEIRRATAQRRVTMLGEISRHGARNPLDPLSTTSSPEAREVGMDNVLQDDVLLTLAEQEAESRMGEGTTDTLTRNRIDHVAHILKVRRARYTALAVVVVTAVTIFTLLYPTLVQASGQVLQCEELDLGVHGMAQLSSNQRDVACDSAYYRVFQRVSIAMIMVYGVSVPAGLVAVVLLLRRLGGMSFARAVLAFIMAGLKPELWFWESVNMGRKFMAMFVVVFFQDAKLQIIVLMWVMVMGFILNVTFVPYTSQLAYALDSLGLAAIVVTLNLVLMFFFFLDGNGDYVSQVGAVGISVGIIAVNLLTVIAFAAAIAQHAYLRFIRWRESRDDSELLRDLASQRVTEVGTVAGSVDALRTRRITLDEAIRRVEDRVTEAEMEALAHRASLFEKKQVGGWTFPIDDDAQRKSGDHASDASMVFGEAADSASLEESEEEWEEEQSPLLLGSPLGPSQPLLSTAAAATTTSGTRESKRSKSAVTFASEGPTSTEGSPRTSTAGAVRSRRARARVPRAPFTEFEVASPLGDLGGGGGAAAPTSLWVSGAAPPKTNDTAPSAVGRGATATREAPVSHAPFLGTSELLAALGGGGGGSDDGEPLEFLPRTLVLPRAENAKHGRTANAGSSQPWVGGNTDLPSGLTAEALRRLHGESPQGHDHDTHLGGIPPLRFGDDEDAPALPRLDAKLLLGEVGSSESDEAGGSSLSRQRFVAPSSSVAVRERVTNWQQGVLVSPNHTPTTDAFPFEHQYHRDEEAEVEFLEGRSAEPPPALREIFTDAVVPFDPRDEWTRLGALSRDADMTPCASPLEGGGAATRRMETGKEPQSPVKVVFSAHSQRLRDSSDGTVRTGWMTEPQSTSRRSLGAQVSDDVTHFLGDEHDEEHRGELKDATLDDLPSPLPKLGEKVTTRIMRIGGGTSTAAVERKGKGRRLSEKTGAHSSSPSPTPNVDAFRWFGAGSDDEDEDDDGPFLLGAPRPVLQTFRTSPPVILPAAPTIQPPQRHSHGGSSTAPFDLGINLEQVLAGDDDDDVGGGAALSWWQGSSFRRASASGTSGLVGLLSASAATTPNARATAQATLTSRGKTLTTELADSADAEGSQRRNVTLDVAVADLTGLSGGDEGGNLQASLPSSNAAVHHTTGTPTEVAVAATAPILLVGQGIHSGGAGASAAASGKTPKGELLSFTPKNASMRRQTSGVQFLLPAHELENSSEDLGSRSTYLKTASYLDDDFAHYSVHDSLRELCEHVPLYHARDGESDVDATRSGGLAVPGEGRVEGTSSVPWATMEDDDPFAAAIRLRAGSATGGLEALDTVHLNDTHVIARAPQALRRAPSEGATSPRVRASRVAHAQQHTRALAATEPRLPPPALLDADFLLSALDMTPDDQSVGRWLSFLDDKDGGSAAVPPPPSSSNSVVPQAPVVPLANNVTQFLDDAADVMPPPSDTVYEEPWFVTGGNRTVGVALDDRRNRLAPEHGVARPSPSGAQGVPPASSQITAVRRREKKVAFGRFRQTAPPPASSSAVQQALSPLVVDFEEVEDLV